MSLNNELPGGYRLDQEVVVQELIGKGGFSLVYLAFDKALDRRVALKEYMPQSLARRGPDLSVIPHPEQNRDSFEFGRQSFVNEAKLLAFLDHPSLARVYRFLEANGTAYMVMPYYQGSTLKEFLAGLRTRPEEAWLRAFLAPLLDVLEYIHKEKIYHRDIAPDNIMLLNVEGGIHPLLIDLGAARRDTGQRLTVIVKDGYAPREQYHESGEGGRQGAWTDIYALSAVMYGAVTGLAPIQSTKRAASGRIDPLVPAKVAGAGSYSPSFLAAIDAGLAMEPEQRPQSITALRRLYFSSEDEPTVIWPSAPLPVPPVPVGPVPQTEPFGSDWFKSTAASEAADPTSAPGTADGRRPSLSSHRFVLFSAGAVVVIGGLWLLSEHTPIPQPSDLLTPPLQSEAPQTPPQAPPQTPPQALPQAQTPPQTPPQTSPEAQIPPLTKPETLTRPEAQLRTEPKTQPKADSPAEAFEQWIAGRTPGIDINMRLPETVVIGNHASITASLKTNRPGYLYLVAHRPPDNQLTLLYPGGIDVSRRLEADRPVQIELAQIAFQGASPGRWRWMALLTARPWDLSGWNLRGALPVLQVDKMTPMYCMQEGPCTGEFGAQDGSIDLEMPPPPRRPERPGSQANPADCGRILQQMSLGDSSPALAARFKSLGCR